MRREWQAQIERAELWGFSVGHLDAHLSGVELKPEFFDVYLDLADEYRLPLRLPGTEEERRIGFAFRELADERGVLAPDRVIPLMQFGNDTAELLRSLHELPPGVTELHAHPAFNSPELLRAATPEWETRTHENALLESLADALALMGAVAPRRIAYGDLTAAMRD